MVSFMFKIDRKKVKIFWDAFMLVSSFCLGACTNKEEKINEENTYENNSVFGANELNDDNCYIKALNFASTISDEVYLYEDVIMNGNPVNLAISNDTQKELKLSK